MEPQLEAAAAVLQLTAVFKGRVQEAPSEVMLRLLDSLLRILRRSRRITVSLRLRQIHCWMVAACPLELTQCQLLRCCQLHAFIKVGCRMNTIVQMQPVQCLTSFTHQAYKAASF